VRDRLSSLLSRFSAPQRRLITIGSVAVVVAIAWAITARIWPGTAPLGVVLQGAVFGTVTGLLAIGLVLIYRTNKIINFAYASMGGVAGVLSVMMFTEGEVNYFVSMLCGVVTALLVGAIVEVTAIRRFQNATRLILTVATIGLAQALGVFQTYIQRWFGSTGLVGGFETPFTFNFQIHPVVFTGDHMVIIAAVPPIILALAIVDWYGPGNLGFLIVVICFAWIAVTSALLTTNYQPPDMIRGAR
jgi:branched-chain amino acid transport system permease protein